MKILPAKGKTSKKRRNEKLFGASKLRRIKTSWKEKATKERVIKFVGKPSEESKFILSLREKKTSPKTLKIQGARTAKIEPVLFWNSANGTYVISEQQ